MITSVFPAHQDLMAKGGKAGGNWGRMGQGLSPWSGPVSHQGEELWDGKVGASHILTSMSTIGHLSMLLCITATYFFFKGDQI